MTALAVSLLLPLLAMGCSADPAGRTSSPPPKATATPAASAAPANIEKIASMTDCAPEMRADAEELRQAVCVTAEGNWIVTTFPTEKLKLTWLDTASMYGGTYLVGPKWAIGAEPQLLERLRPKVGGELQKLRGMS
ncbi:hypothetical protein OG875_17150 [Streptomyces sp. NBC_01498]|uniref:hypothetical protein n=1 Tax=Streptomyces sp. NBC_01498 TaxID=2975870 RepID=UPI002E7B893D|nr:hypothetical protein [Streptomyces sp. NBC_01498]WTL26169.1 hypothetical protein OG875_17150 [Streptomyces sp. NBC_01498]